MHKCLKDNDDEVRERAYFFIKLLEKSSEKSCLAEEYEDESFVEGDEKVDLVKFIFNSENTIDVDALESYVLQNQ